MQVVPLASTVQLSFNDFIASNFQLKLMIDTNTLKTIERLKICNYLPAKTRNRSKIYCFCINLHKEINREENFDSCDINKTVSVFLFNSTSRNLIYAPLIELHFAPS